MSRVAVVILTYNSREWITLCLERVRQLTTPVEIVVADNGSTDGTLQSLIGDSGVRVLDLGRNWGFAEGYNRALQQVDADWYVLLNPDAFLAPNWVETLLTYAAQHPQAQVLGGKLLFYAPTDPTPRVQSAGACFTEAGSAFEIGWGTVDSGAFETARVTASIPGAALLIRRETFWQYGGFDAAYFTYLEDVDLCWRIWLGGGEVHYVPQAVAWHYFGAAGGGRVSAYRIEWMQRNRLANMVKFLSPWMLARSIVVSLAYDAYRVLEFAGRRDGAALRALWRGTIAFLQTWRPVWAQRRALQATRRISDAELMRRGLLVSALTAMREYRRLAKM